MLLLLLPPPMLLLLFHLPPFKPPLLINSFPDAPKPPSLTKPTTGRAAHASCRRG
jgi:hypothetical protein